MVNIKIKDIELSKLNNEINEIRDILNELCTAFDGKEAENERLIISRYLDDLIVEYMNQINKNKETI